VSECHEGKNYSACTALLYLCLLLGLGEKGREDFTSTLLFVYCYTFDLLQGKPEGTRYHFEAVSK
jgi:hypothetical protein